MYTVEKIHTDNPFTDNLIYYAKYIALNSVVKDLDEALANETPESLHNGDIYISCVEGHATYEMFTYFPEEILEKYIELSSNLDVLVGSKAAFETYMNGLSSHVRTTLMNKILTLSKTVYIDHYNIIKDYIKSEGPTWLLDNKDVYDKCIEKTATIDDLFNLIPQYTIKRILKTYINNYKSDDIELISSSLEEFNKYISNRDDLIVDIEIKNICTAMSSCFKSHYETMQQRGYINEDGKNNWIDYILFVDVYEKCIDGTATYNDLYVLLPQDDLLEVLNTVFTPQIVSQYYLDVSYEYLSEYLKNTSMDPVEDEKRLNALLIDYYIRNYNIYMNFDIYNKCLYDEIDYYTLYDYLPKETLKMILNTFIPEVTNLEIYSNSVEMLNSYLSSIDKNEADKIRESITADMISWYVANYKETNNYYRTLIGLPPMDENKVQYKDTLLRSYNELTDSYIEFGDTLLNMIPKGIYPDIHWTRLEICEFDQYDISILNEYGVLDKYKELAKRTDNRRYKYFDYLGDNKLNIYTCRKAYEYELIGMPTVDNSEIKKIFVDKYVINRDYIIKTVCSDAYKFQSDYYNKFIIIFIMINTIMDVLADIPRMIINRDIFDSRCIKYLFESYGIPYYSEIPVKYQQAMLKNLNILIKYKSSTKNMIDICNLFGFSDIKVFGYYMLKEHNKDSNTGEYIFKDESLVNYDLDKLYVKDKKGSIKDISGVRYSLLTEYKNYDAKKYTDTITIQNNDGSTTEKVIIKNTADVYIMDGANNIFIPLKDADYFKKIKANNTVATLKFVKVPIDESLTDYKNNKDYIINYDEIVNEDDTWDGGTPHELVKQDIIDYNFNAVLTKYISVETITKMTELTFQVSYFYNMLFDNLYSEEALTVEIPYIKVGHKFKFMDVVCYLFALMYVYNGIEDNIMYSPTQMLYIKGYNFNKDLDTVLKDVKAFSQADNPMDQENIFDINKRIIEDSYDYQKAFDSYAVKAFNLKADIDALDEWLKHDHQMSLDDFIVDESTGLTLRQFFSLNNSYYQKSLFINALLPTQYNQDIKYAFDEDTYEQVLKYDINRNAHAYIEEYDNEDHYYLLVIDSTDNELFIINNERYMSDGKDSYAIYNKYYKDNDEYNLSEVDYYYYDKVENTYNKVLSNDIFVRDTNGDYIFSANKYFTKSNDEYSEVNYNEFVITDSNNKKVLNFGKYYIYKDGKYELDPDNCYIMVERDGQKQYILIRYADDYTNNKISPENTFVRKSNGKFVCLLDTDFYERQPDGTYIYNEDECYKIASEPTEYFDPAIPNVYYEKLSEYYKNTDYTLYTDICYVKDADGNYIPEDKLLSPNNCYYYNDIKSSYELVIDNLFVFYDYDDQFDCRYILILQDNNNYNKYQISNNKLELVPSINKVFVRDSVDGYVLALIQNANYDDTHKMIVVFNKDINSSSSTEEYVGKYNPEVTDGVWDENDWFYPDKSYNPDSGIGMNGENTWYYKKPGEDTPSDDDEYADINNIGSGFYLSAETYMGSYTMESGSKYYISMDVETNFDGKVQIYCESDSDCKDTTCRVYEFTAEEVKHISQVFVANNIEKPRLLFLMYNFKDNPIENGDYIIIKNIRFVKAYSDNYIAQDIESYDKLQELYKTNEAIYRYLVELMNNCSDYETYQIYKKLYDSLMTSKYNKEAFKLEDGTYAKTYTDFLQTRDSVLYEKLVYFKSLDDDAMKKEIADNIIEVSYAIDDCVDTYSYGYLYSYFPAVSASYIQEYISKIINFFKSWKVHLLGINTIYKFDDPLENTVKILEKDEYRVKLDDQRDNVFVNDCIKINPMDSYSDNGYRYTDLYPDLVQYSHHKDDNVTILDRVVIISKTTDRLEYKDSYSKIDLVLSNDEAKANIDDNGDLIVTDNSGLSVGIPNKLLLSIDDGTLFGTRAIHEINNNCKDIID